MQGINSLSCLNLNIVLGQFEIFFDDSLILKAVLNFSSCGVIAYLKAYFFLALFL